MNLPNLLLVMKAFWLFPIYVKELKDCKQICFSGKIFLCWILWKFESLQNPGFLACHVGLATRGCAINFGATSNKADVIRVLSRLTGSA